MALAGCSSTARQVPIPYAIVLSADPQVNPDINQRPSPIQVTVYELKSPGAFQSRDYFSLQADPQAALGKDLLNSDQVIVKPGETQMVERPGNPEARVVGIVAGYRDLEHSQWRLVIPLPEAQNTNIYKVWQFSPQRRKDPDLGRHQGPVGDRTRPILVAFLSDNPNPTSWHSGTKSSGPRGCSCVPSISSSSNAISNMRYSNAASRGAGLLLGIYASFPGPRRAGAGQDRPDRSARRAPRRYALRILAGRRGAAGAGRAARHQRRARDAGAAARARRRGRHRLRRSAGHAGLRYLVAETEVEDSGALGLEPALLQVRPAAPAAMLESEMTDEWLGLGVARVAERRADNRVVLDESVISPRGWPAAPIRCCAATCRNSTACWTRAARPGPPRVGTGTRRRGRSLGFHAAGDGRSLPGRGSGMRGRWKRCIPNACSTTG